MRLNKDELLNIRGGNISAAMVGAIVKGIDVIMDVGRSFGSAIRRMRDGNTCPY